MIKKIKSCSEWFKTHFEQKKILPLKGQGLSLWKACSLQRLSPRGHFGLKIQKKIFWSEMAWNVFKIDSSKIGFFQNFLIYCDKFDNKIIYCLSHFRAGNFSPAPTSSLDSPSLNILMATLVCNISLSLKYRTFSPNITIFHPS